MLLDQSGVAHQIDNTGRNDLTIRLWPISASTSSRKRSPAYHYLACRAPANWAIPHDWIHYLVAGVTTFLFMAVGSSGVRTNPPYAATLPSKGRVASISRAIRSVPLPTPHEVPRW